jgi:CO dehydrogenase/acetyl-CoA synthase gamma subunit (corrinoid Fe-S protein)
MINADLYTNHIDFLKYLPHLDCEECGVSTCEEFALKLKLREISFELCPHLISTRKEAFRLVFEALDSLPQIPASQMPTPGITGIYEVGSPGHQSPVLVSGNSEYTQQVILTVLSLCSYNCLMVFADSEGSTVDMAMIFGTFTAAKIRKIISEHIMEGATRRPLILPGLAAPLKEEAERLMGRRILMGPICAVELPLFLDQAYPSAHADSPR